MQRKRIENIPETITREISEKIIRNELKPGERIYEAKIAEELGVSRSPVREALRILEKNRLVELIPRKGARVAEISSAHIEWFYDVFEALYGLAARKVTEKAGEQDRADLGAALEKIEAAASAKDVEKYYEGIFEFAAIGMRAAANPLLAQILMDLWPSNRRIQYATISRRKDTLEENAGFFRKIYELLDSPDEVEAEAAVRAYARNEKQVALEMIYGKKRENDRDGNTKS